MPDTAEYDHDLREIWDFMARCGYPLCSWWPGFEGFDGFMCGNLV